MPGADSREIMIGSKLAHYEIMSHLGSGAAAFSITLLQNWKPPAK